MLESGATITVPVREISGYEGRKPPPGVTGPAVGADGQFGGCNTCAHNTANIAEREADAARNAR